MRLKGGQLNLERIARTFLQQENSKGVVVTQFSFYPKMCTAFSLKTEYQKLYLPSILRYSTFKWNSSYHEKPKIGKK